MKRNNLIIAGILALIIVLGLIFVLNNKQEKPQDTSGDQQEVKQEEMTELMKNRCSVKIGPKPEYCYQ